VALVILGSCCSCSAKFGSGHYVKLNLLEYTYFFGAIDFTMLALLMFVVVVRALFLLWIDLNIT